jgi:hypothetical protein
VHIPRTGAAGSGRSAHITSVPGKGKEKAAPSGSASKARSWLASSDTETLSEEAAPLERRRRLAQTDGSSVDGLPTLEQQAPKKAAASQSIPWVVASMVSGGSNGSSGNGSVATVKEATTTVVAVKAKKVADVAVVKEATVAKKAIEVVAEEVTAVKVAAEATTAKVPEEAVTEDATGGTKTGDDDSYELEVVIGHPELSAPRHVSLFEVMSTTHFMLCQA